MAKDPRILILGAGPTGLGAAWRLKEAGYTNWLLAEKGTAAGGLAASLVDEKGFTWDLGPHVLHSHYDYFDRVMDGLPDVEWLKHRREAWIWIKERFVPYPLQNNLRGLPMATLGKCLYGLFQRRHYQKGDVKNFKDWIYRQFGPGIATLFLMPYNRKVWATDPADMDVQWMGDRVSTLSLSEAMTNVFLGRDNRQWGPNAFFRFPARGGTGAIWKAVNRQLPQDHIRLNNPARRIDAFQRRVEFADGRTDSYDVLLSTIPLDQLADLMADVPAWKEKSKTLRHTTTHLVGLGMEGPIPESLSQKSWIYLPESRHPFYRISVFSNFSPNNVPTTGGQYWSLLCEAADEPSAVRPLKDVAAAGEKALREAGILPMSSRIASRWMMTLRHGYPVPFLGRDSVLAEIEKELRAVNIWSRGRFGGWKYEASNQDHCFMQGVEFVDHVLHGQDEVTYPQPFLVNQRSAGHPKKTASPAS